MQKIKINPSFTYKEHKVLAGKIVFDDSFWGHVEMPDNEDGYFFSSKDTRLIIRFTEARTDTTWERLYPPTYREKKNRLEHGTDRLDQKEYVYAIYTAENFIVKDMASIMGRDGSWIVGIIYYEPKATGSHISTEFLDGFKKRCDEAFEVLEY
jgi:hypothetical protein